MKDISQAPGDLTKFLDNMLHNTVVSFHSDLSSKRVSPWDTGRFAASWFVESALKVRTVSYKNKLYDSATLCLMRSVCALAIGQYRSLRTGFRLISMARAKALLTALLRKLRVCYELPTDSRCYRDGHGQCVG